jgi:type I restriction enzyme M protein
MDANEYKDYLLGIVFYKYLSDSFLIKVYDLVYDEKPESLKAAIDAYREVLEDESAEELKEQIKAECHYVIEPEMTYTSFAEAARNNAFNREQLQKAFNNIEQSDPIFADLFTDIDLYSNRLGAGDQKQSDTISSLIKEIDRADLLNSDADVLGNAYEYLIGQFASETGKKAGEFYTPQAVSKILTKIAIAGQETKRGLTVYDPCMGSGSLLLNAKKYATEPNYIRYFGQELMTSTYNLARMNMFLHGILPENQKLRNADTLDADWPTGEETEFDMVLMNPPYSAKWSAASGFLQDERFSDYGVLAPKSKADYSFLLHGLYHLKNSGTMAIVLPHGVLFRGAAEGKIREKLLRSGNIYAVIGLPANLFYNTSIPTCIIVLKKHRDGRDVLFIDASPKFEKGKKQNAMTDAHIDSIIELYNNRQTVEKEAFLASFEDIERNDFNLNIPRYVDNFEKEEEIDLNELLAEMKQTDDEIGQVQGDFVSFLKDLTSSDEEIMASLDKFIEMIEG